MLRLVSARGFRELRRCGRLVSSRKVSSACPRRLHCILSRHFTAGSPAWKDATQSKEDSSAELIDLEKWKSVMRAQAALGEKRKAIDDEEAGRDGHLKEPGGDLKDGGVQEAMRDLVTMWRQAGKQVPQELTDEHVQILAELTTKSAKKKYLRYLAQKEDHKMYRKEKLQKKKAEKEAFKAQSIANGENEQKDLKKTFLLQFWERSLDRLLAWRSAQAMVFGQPLVFDMSYDSNMSRREIENTVSQLMKVEGWNRRTTEPFHLHYCNLQPNGLYMQELVKKYGQETWENLLITSTDRRHVDVFPHKQLVYLTADSPTVLRKFDHSKIYIIGAIVDRSIQSGLSLANAKRLKLATARLPLDDFLHWDTGAKNLTLDQMMCIMSTLKETGKWEEALKFVPVRKHSGFHKQREEANGFHMQQTQREDGTGRVPMRKHDGFHIQQTQRKDTTGRVPLRKHDGFHMQQTQREDATGRVPMRKHDGLHIQQTQREDAISGPNHRPHEDGDRWLRSGERTVNSQYRPNKQSDGDRMAGLPRDREQPGTTRVRTSIKNAMEGRKGAGKSKMWWNDE